MLLVVGPTRFGKTCLASMRQFFLDPDRRSVGQKGQLFGKFASVFASPARRRPEDDHHLTWTTLAHHGMTISYHWGLWLRPELVFGYLQGSAVATPYGANHLGNGGAMDHVRPI